MTKTLVVFASLALWGAIALGKDAEIEKAVATYQANQARFHSLYRGKSIIVIGTVQSIKTDPLGIGVAYFIYVDVNGSQIQCESGDRNMAASLDKGQRLWFSGQMQDVTLGVLRVSNCKFESAAETEARRKQEAIERQKKEQLARKAQSARIRADKSLMQDLRKVQSLVGVLDEVIEQMPDTVATLEEARKWDVAVKGDLNGDGVPDYVLRHSMYCGSGGCSGFYFLSNKERHLFTYVAEFSSAGRSNLGTVPDIDKTVYKISCSGGYGECPVNLKWDGKRFVETLAPR